MSGALQAVLWISEGNLFRDNILVPDPPPSAYCIALAPRAIWALDEEIDVHAPFPIHEVIFRLTKGPHLGGERVHYELVSQPPEGYRWCVHGGNIWAEAIGEHHE